MDHDEEPRKGSEPEDEKTSRREVLTKARQAAYVARVGYLAAALWFGLPGSGLALDTPTQTRLAASDAAASDLLGYSVAISGDTMVAGACGKSSSAGAVYVFTRSGSTWSQQQKLTASDAATSDVFGISVAISGDTIVVGAYGKSSYTGAAYVFTRSGSTWIPQQTLTASDGAAGDYFGNSVTISGDTLVVGAYRKSSNTGAAYVYTRSGSTWSPQQKLTASDAAASDYFGRSVAISGETLVVGAEGKSSYRGAAYVFTRFGSTWSPQQTLTASDAAQWHYFGRSVAISGDTVVVGNIGRSSYAGAAYVFTRSGSTWSPQQTLTASDAAANDYLGISVAVSGDTVLAGAYAKSSYTGAAYLFTRSGSTWSQRDKQTGAASSDNFGRSVSIAGDAAVAGSPYYDISAGNEGAAYIYTYACGFGRNLTTSQWTMFTLPCQSTATTVQTVFSGLSAGDYDTRWVVYARDEANNVYTKLGLSSTLTQGKGYWFDSLDAARLEVTGTATAWSSKTGCMSTAGCYEITLTKPPTSSGLYNLAGHPFAYDVDWADVRVVPNAGTAVTPSDAETAGSMSKTFHIWNGSSYDAYDDATPGMLGSLLANYGMWVKVKDPALTSITLLIPAYGYTAVGMSSLRLGGGSQSGTGQLLPGEWYVRLIAAAPAEGLKDRGHVLGQLRSSEQRYDAHDLEALAPSHTPYLTIVFPHWNWGAKAGDYASDYHPVKPGADTWDFEVRTDNPRRQIELSWQATGDAPLNMSLRDTKTGAVIPVQAGRYVFTMGALARSFTWRSLSLPAQLHR